MRIGGSVSLVVLAMLSVGRVEARELSADSSAPADATTGEADIAGDIVVTARRREESLQKVPVSVTAFDQESLRARGIENLIDLQKATPGVVFAEYGTSINPVYTIRGQQKAAAGAGLPSVITYLNDVPMPNIGSAAPSYDLSSVQVLKGPQGTLFGRNTTGGAVLVTTRAPDYELGGYLQVSAGNRSMWDFEGALNVPLVEDAVALRLAGKITRRDGWTKNVGVGADYGDRHRNSFRASLLIEPSSAIKNTTVLDYYDQDEAGSAEITNAILATGPQRVAALAPYYDCGTSPSCDVDLVPDLGPRKTDVNLAPRTTAKVWGVSNTTSIDLDAVKIKNIVAYRSGRYQYQQDQDGTPLRLLDVYIKQGQRQFTEELQFFGKLFDRVDWLVGGFYLKDKPDGPQGQATDAFRPDAFPISNTVNTSAFFSNTSKALYGQLSVEVVDGLKVDAGLRQTWDRQTGCSIKRPLKFPYYSDQLTLDECKSGNGYEGAVKSNQLTYTFGINYNPTQDWLLYATTRKGYRGAGFNLPKFNPNLDPVQSFTPETVKDVELGSKLNWSAGGWRGRLNVAAYRSKYSNIQSLVTVGPNFDGDNDPSNDPQNFFLIANIASATIKGVEVDGVIVPPIDGLQLSYGLGYTDAKYGQTALPPALASAGATLPAFAFTPKWSFSVAADWKIVDTQDKGSITLHGSYYWVDKMYHAQRLAPAYDRLDARIDWENVMGLDVDLAVFVNNVFDSDDIVGNGVSNGSLGFYSAIYGDPRMAGVSVRKSF